MDRNIKRRKIGVIPFFCPLSFCQLFGWNQTSLNAETQRARRNAEEKDIFFLPSLRPSANLCVSALILCSLLWPSRISVLCLLSSVLGPRSSVFGLHVSRQPGSMRSCRRISSGNRRGRRGSVERMQAARKIGGFEPIGQQLQFEAGKAYRRGAHKREMSR